jgi:phospholipid/cholesterol/gamma-HCH transport system ATP-binding protein
MTQTENDVVIRLRGIRNQFGSHVVHDNLDLDVYRGEVLGVVGASGTGKSVLLRTIAGLQSPKAGEIEVLGTNVRTASEADRQALERRWGVMFQDGALFSSLNVRENVEVPLRSVKVLTPELRHQMADLKISL